MFLYSLKPKRNVLGDFGSIKRCQSYRVDKSEELRSTLYFLRDTRVSGITKIANRIFNKDLFLVGLLKEKDK